MHNGSLGVDILAPVEMSAKVMTALGAAFEVHREGHPAAAAERIRGIALGPHYRVDAAMIDRLPKLEIIANFGVGYDSIDTAAAARRGVIVTNTPDVLTEEVADTALALLTMTVRELSAAERYLRAGRWVAEGNFRLSPATLRDRTVGIVGLGRIGLAIARRLDAAGVPVVYNNRRPRTDVSYPHYGDLLAMARDVDTLMVVLPGGKATEHAINRAVLDALGPRGVVINMGRGSVVDEPELAAALAERRIHAAGLDVYPHEPQVSPALLALDNVVLLPHVGSASVFTRDAMGQLVVDNLTSWFRSGKPLTPVPETPWPRS